MFVNSTHLLHLHRLQVGIASVLAIIVRSRDQKKHISSTPFATAAPIVFSSGLVCATSPFGCGYGIIGKKLVKQVVNGADGGSSKRQKVANPTSSSIWTRIANVNQCRLAPAVEFQLSSFSFRIIQLSILNSFMSKQGGDG